jgi:glycine/D-amino acid oxidase-like deaminating enzyme
MADDTLTRQRDLREAEPLWAQTPRITLMSRKAVPVRHFDVVVVGAGISGALMADALADGKRSVLVVDRRRAVHGSTMASTAMIQHEIDVPLHKLSGMIGAAKANRVWRRSASSVDALADRVEERGISCSMKRKKTLYLSGDEFDADALAKEYDARKKAGLDAQLLDRDEVAAQFGLDREAGIVSDASASGNPAQMAAGFLRESFKRGAGLVEGIEITDLRETSDGVVLATSDGSLIEAGHAIFCTGYEFLEALASQNHDVVSTWALASAPGLTLPDWLPDHLVWEGSDPYLYFRSTRDRRLIVGGEDEDDGEAFADPKKLKTKATTITKKVEALLGMKIGAHDSAWAAAFGTTNDGLPLIGLVPEMKHTFAVMGFGGNGITFSKIAAEIVSAEIAGQPDPDAKLFAFSR